MVKTTSSSVGLRVYIVVMIIGLFMTISSAKDAITLLKDDPADLNDKKISGYNEGEMVEGNMRFAFDIIAKLETSRTVYGIPVNKTETPYYLVYSSDSSQSENGHYVVMHLTDKNSMVRLHSLMVYTKNLLAKGDAEKFYKNTEPYMVKTKTVEMPKEVKEYLYQYFEESGMTKAECDEMVADCVLEEIDYSQTKVLPFIGLGLMLVASLIFVPTRIKKKPKTTYVNEFPAGGFVPQNGNADNTNQAGMMDEINTDDIFR